jgi:hypothetical protein
MAASRRRGIAIPPQWQGEALAGMNCIAKLDPDHLRTLGRRQGRRAGEQGREYGEPCTMALKPHC